MNAIMENDYTASLHELGESLPRPKAVMVISAHWLAKATFVNCIKNPEQIYDFFGFPPELYQVRYPCPGAPDEARMVARVTKYMVNCAADWGVDHAAWAVLTHMYPNADVPVFEMSVCEMMDAAYHYDIGRRLGALRREGILVIGSGNIVHNLQMMDYDVDAERYPWAVEIDEKIKSLLVSRDHAPLVNYADIGKHVRLAVPAVDHYFPMLCVLGMQERDDDISFIYEGFQHGSISMRSFIIG